MSTLPIYSAATPAVPATITVEEAGRILGISRSAAYRAAKRGEIPTLRIGRRLVVPAAIFFRMLGIDSGPLTVPG